MSDLNSCPCSCCRHIDVPVYQEPCVSCGTTDGWPRFKIADSTEMPREASTC